MTIAEGLKHTRQAANYTVKEISEKLGIFKQNYSKYETEKVIPNADFIVKLAKAFNVSADCLLGLTTDPTPYWQNPPKNVETPAKSAEKTFGETQKQIEILQAEINALKARIEVLEKKI